MMEVLTLPSRKSVVVDRMSIARIAANLGVSWHTVNAAVLTAGHRLLIADPTRPARRLAARCRMALLPVTAPS